MKYYVSTLLAVVILFASSCITRPKKEAVDKPQPNIITDTISRIDAINDFKTFRSALETIHPALYKYTPKPEMDALFDSLQATIKPGMSILLFYKLLRFATCQVKCTHTFIEFDDRLRNTLQADITERCFLNIGVFYNNGHYYLQSDNLDQNHAELQSVGGHSIPELFAGLRQYSGIDGGVDCVDSFSLGDDFYFKYFLAYDLSRHLLTPHPNSDTAVQITYKANGVIKTDSLWKRTFTFADKGRENSPLFKFPEDVGHDFVINDSLHFALLTINSFSFSDQKAGPFKHFIENCFELLSYRKDIKKLVIDLRDNTGGNMNIMNYLASFTLGSGFKKCAWAKANINGTDKLAFKIKGHNNNLDFIDSSLRNNYDSVSENAYFLNPGKISSYSPQKNCFKGKIIILTNHNTCSAASCYASLHHDRKRAVIIGEETNGDYTGLNCFYQLEVTLPNTKLKIIIPVVEAKFDLRNKRYIENRGVIPDVILHQSLDDVMDDTDTQLRFAEKY